MKLTIVFLMLILSTSLFAEDKQFVEGYNVAKKYSLGVNITFDEAWSLGYFVGEIWGSIRIFEDSGMIRNIGVWTNQQVSDFIVTYLDKNQDKLNDDSDSIVYNAFKDYAIQPNQSTRS